MILIFGRCENMKRNKDYFEDDRPVNYDKYLNMSDEELDAEIKHLETDVKEQNSSSKIVF